MRILLALATLIIAASLSPLVAQYEEAAIKEVLREAYENGFHNEGIPRNLELGFSENFRAITIEDGALVVHTLADYLQILANNQAKGVYPRAQGARRSLFFHRVELNGEMVEVKINLNEGGKPIAVEYIQLYKSPTGWLIVQLTHLPK